MPEHFDYIILGTGLQQCILAYELSKQGYKVLQLDHNQTYGEDLRTLKLSELLRKNDVVRDIKIRTYDNVIFEIGGYKEIVEQYNASNIEKDVSGSKNIHDHEKSEIKEENNNAKSDAEIMEQTQKTTSDQSSALNTFLEHDREFNIDITPKFILAGGQMKEYLVANGIQDLVSFVSVTGNYIFSKGLHRIPYDEKTAVSSGLISLLQKPRLVQFFWKVRKFCAAVQEYRDHVEADINTIQFEKYLKSKIETQKTMQAEFEHFSLSKSSIELIGHAIALNLNDNYLITHPFHTYIRLYNFLYSLLFTEDKSPFMYPLYGLSELSQAFSRRAASYGCVYMLHAKMLRVEHAPVLEQSDYVNTFDKEQFNASQTQYLYDSTTTLASGLEKLSVTETDKIGVNGHKSKSNMYNSEIGHINKEQVDLPDDYIGKHNTQTADSNKDLDTHNHIKVPEPGLNDEFVKNNPHVASQCMNSLQDDNENKDISKQENTQLFTNKKNDEYANQFKYSIEISQESNLYRFNCNTIISSPSYFPHLICESYKVITTILILNQSNSLVKDSCAHVVFLATELKRKNDIFVAYFSASESCCPETCRIAIVSTIYEDDNTNYEAVIEKLGKIVHRTDHIRDVNQAEGFDIVFTRDVDETTHFESLFENAQELLRMINART